MRSKVFSFYFGSLGVETCSLDAALVPATVDNCLRATVVWVKWPCLWRVLQEWALLEVSSVAWRSFVSRGRRGTLWHSNVSHNVSKVVLCGRRSTFASFSQDELQFSWQAQHFGDLHRLFAWQAQHLRHVVLRVILRLPLLRLREVVTRCKFRGRRGILWHVLKSDGSLARNIDFEVANFKVHEKTRRKT